jgi:hypothetical protein
VDEWICIGNESTEQLSIQQCKYYVKVIKRKKYVRNHDESAQDSDCGIRLILPAKAFLPRSLLDTSLLSGALCSKIVDAMLFYRAKKAILLFSIKPLHQARP